MRSNILLKENYPVGGISNKSYCSSASVALSLMASYGIQELLDMDGVTEIAINQTGRIWYLTDNWYYIDNTKLTFINCMSLARALVVFSQSKQNFDDVNPIASVVLPNGERGQIMIPPACEKDTVVFTIRKPSLQRFTLDDYNKTGRLQPEKATEKQDNLTPELKKLYENNQIVEFLTKAVTGNLNILLVGGTGSGKTTAMKALVDLYPKDKRLITIEDVHELQLPLHDNHVHLFYKKGGVTPKLIIESCMRLTPDHIFLAELRGDEAWSYLEALNTGHKGSITTIHANDCYSGLMRLTNLIKQSEVGQTLDLDFIKNVVNESIDLVLFFKYTHLTEILFNRDEV